MDSNSPASKKFQENQLLLKEQIQEATLESEKSLWLEASMARTSQDQIKD
jgi:hypothetical protein